MEHFLQNYSKTINSSIENLKNGVENINAELLDAPFTLNNKELTLTKIIDKINKYLCIGKATCKDYLSLGTIKEATTALKAACPKPADEK